MPFGSIGSVRVRFEFCSVRFKLGSTSVWVSSSVRARCEFDRFGSSSVLFVGLSSVSVRFGSLREAPSGHPQDWRCCLGEEDVQDCYLFVYNFRVRIEFG